MDYKVREDILKKMVVSMILPKYPDLDGVIVSSRVFRGMIEFRVLLIKNTFLMSMEDKIVDEIHSLFKMASLNERHINGRDYVVVDFA